MSLPEFEALFRVAGAETAQYRAEKWVTRQLAARGATVINVPNQPLATLPNSVN